MISLDTNLFSSAPPAQSVSSVGGKNVQNNLLLIFLPGSHWLSLSHPCWAANYSNLAPTTSTTSTASTRLHNLKLQDFSVLAHGDSIGVNPRLMGSKDKYEIQSRRKKTCQILQGYMPVYNIPLNSEGGGNISDTPTLPAMEIIKFSWMLKLLQTDQKPRM